MMMYNLNSVNILSIKN